MEVGPYDGALQVLAGFIANFLVFGVSFTFGVFQDFYTSPSGPFPNVSPSTIALIGTLATSLTYLFGIFNRSLSAYFSIRKIMIFGTVLMSLGLILAGFSKEIYQLVLTQGIMFGVGSSLVYLPPVICAPTYFGKHRGIALGILFSYVLFPLPFYLSYNNVCKSGTGFGGLTMAPLSRALITQVGWQWTLRIEGFIALIVLTFASFLVKPHPTTIPLLASQKRIELVNLKIARTPEFILQMLGSLSQSAGYLIPLFYMSLYAQSWGSPLPRVPSSFPSTM